MRAKIRVFLTWGTDDFADITGQVIHHLTNCGCCICKECMINAGYDFRDQCGADRVWFARNTNDFSEQLIEWREGND